MPGDTGIIYFSRVPRDMRPSEIREYCLRFGEIFRQKFLVEATNTRQAQLLKKKIGKNRALQFKEGWIEFTEYRSAVEAAQQMNSQPVDVKRRRRCAGELWNVKSLPRGFRWEDLVTEMEGAKRMRRLKITAEIQREREINERYRQLAYKQIALQKQQLQQGNNNNNNNVQFQQQQEQEQEGDDTGILSASDFVAKNHTSSTSATTNNNNNSGSSDKKKIERNLQRKKVKKNLNSDYSLRMSGNNNNNNNNNNNITSENSSSTTNSVQARSATKKKSSSSSQQKFFTNEGFRDLYTN